MTRVNTISESEPKLGDSVHARDAKDTAKGAEASGIDTPSAERKPSPKRIDIGWSLLVFGAFCIVCWGLILLGIRFFL